MSILDKIDDYLTEQGSKEEYRKLFMKILSKYGVDEPDKLDDEKKKKFFDEVDKAWKADKETD